MQAQQRLLGDVLCLGDAAEHPVGDREREPPQLLGLTHLSQPCTPSRRGGMKIFLAGATGAAGQALIPLLTSHGHTVTGTTRSPSKTDLLRALGAEPVVVDGLDRDGIRAAVATTRPDAIIHEMTALGGDLDLRQVRARRSPPPTACAPRAPTTCSRRPARRASSASSRRATAPGRTSGRAAPVKTEDDPLDPDPAQAGAHHARRDPPPRVGGHRRRRHRPALRRLLRPRHRARARRRAVGADQGAQVPDRRRRRRRLLVRAHRRHRGGTLAALERGTPGRIYNIADDEPAPVRVWLPASPRRSARRRRATSRAGSAACSASTSW